MSDTEEKYQILEGVRRAKAAHQSGKSTVPAQESFPDGRLGPIFDVAVDKLLSPKPRIETGGNHFARWRQILRGTQSNAILPPIHVVPGMNGTPIGDVIVEGQDDLEHFY